MTPKIPTALDYHNALLERIKCQMDNEEARLMQVIKRDDFKPNTDSFIYATHLQNNLNQLRYALEYVEMWSPRVILK